MPTVYVETSVVSYLTARPSRDTDSATRLAKELVRQGALPEKATSMRSTLGVAAAHEVAYLLTWNCKHLANATMRGTIDAICRSEGLTSPVICTPEELPAGKLS